MFLYRLVLANLEKNTSEEVFAVGVDPVAVIEKAKAHDAEATVVNLSVVASTDGDDFTKLLDTEVKPAPEATPVAE
jgi:hypothetical protein